MVPTVSHHPTAVSMPKQERAEPGRWQTIGKIALQVLSVAAMASGAALAIAGAVAVTGLAASTGVLGPLFIPCVTAAGYITYFSLQLAQNHVTALGVMFTLPMAAICLSPFLLPITVGAAPGGALIGLGAWGWCVVND